MQRLVSHMLDSLLQCQRYVTFRIVAFGGRDDFVADDCGLPVAHAQLLWQMQKHFRPSEQQIYFFQNLAESA